MLTKSIHAEHSVLKSYFVSKLRKYWSLPVNSPVNDQPVIEIALQINFLQKLKFQERSLEKMIEYESPWWWW